MCSARHVTFCFGIGWPYSSLEPVLARSSTVVVTASPSRSWLLLDSEVRNTATTLLDDESPAIP